MEVKMLAVEGLDKACIGTAVCSGGREVLVYDAGVAEQILADGGYGEEALYPFLVECGFEELGDNAPIFVYLDEELGYELSSKRRGHLKLVH